MWVRKSQKKPEAWYLEVPHGSHKDVGHACSDVLHLDYECTMVRRGREQAGTLYTKWNSYILQVIPMLQGNATDQTPPDLPSFLFKERIVYLVRQRCLLCLSLSNHRRSRHHSPNIVKQTTGNIIMLQGMSLVPAVTELLLAELMYLQYDSPTKPIFMYINSAGVQVYFPSLSCS